MLVTNKIKLYIYIYINDPGFLLEALLITYKQNQTIYCPLRGYMYIRAFPAGSKLVVPLALFLLCLREESNIVRFNFNVSLKQN